MKLLVGLGNPGRKYARTRHNVGWWVLDHLADVWRFGPWHPSEDALVADGSIDGVEVRMVKPQTYMNLSGAALRPYLRRLAFEGLQPNLLVVVDDVAIPLGTWRVRAAGSAGGHNGLKSIEATLATQQYARLRVGVLPAGIDRPPGDLADFVLGEFTADEADEVGKLLPDLAHVVATWATSGVAKAMNARRERTASPEPSARQESSGPSGSSPPDVIGPDASPAAPPDSPEAS